MTQTCALCHTGPDAKTTLCPTCGARRGYRDGSGRVLGKQGPIGLRIMHGVLACGLLWLASQIPLWYHFFPLAFLGGLLCLSVAVFALMLLGGPKWYIQ